MATNKLALIPSLEALIAIMGEESIADNRPQISSLTQLHVKEFPEPMNLTTAQWENLFFILRAVRQTGIDDFKAALQTLQNLGLIEPLAADAEGGAQ